MHELLESATGPEDARASCVRYLRARWPRLAWTRRLLRPELRDDVLVLTAFHRLARELADGDAGATRRRAFGELAEELGRAAGGEATRATRAIGIALADTLRRRGLSALPLQGTLAALEREAHVAAFGTRAELAGHAAGIAGPEARHLAALAGRRSERDEVLADALALGVQLSVWIATAHRDVPRGRVRVPVEELARHGLGPGDLRGTPGHERDERVLRVYAGEVRAARAQLAKGWPLCAALGPRDGRLLALFLRWHAATLTALEARGHDALSGPLPEGWLRVGACAAASAAGMAPPSFA